MADVHKIYIKTNSYYFGHQRLPSDMSLETTGSGTLEDPYTPVQSSSGSYKVYTAILNQTGTEAPVATVLENTLGGEVVWSYLAVGQYVGTLAGAFPSGKTWCNVGSSPATPDIIYLGENIFPDSVYIESTVSFDDQDDTLYNTPIEIRVYL